jgi:hypothetical protein
MFTEIRLHDGPARLSFIPADRSVVIGVEFGEEALQSRDVTRKDGVDPRRTDPDREIARVRLVGWERSERNPEPAQREGKQSTHR